MSLYLLKSNLGDRHAEAESVTEAAAAFLAFWNSELKPGEVPLSEQCISSISRVTDEPVLRP